MPIAPEVTEAPNSPVEPGLDSRKLAAGAAILGLVVFGVYWPALRGQFLWDDFLSVHRNPLVTGEMGVGEIWFRMEFPLSCVAFWLEWLAWGYHPAGYHVVNLLLHATGAVLLWRVLARLRVPASWLAAMLFAVQPMCVESVAYISELKNTLSLPFFLLSVLCYLRLGPELRPSDFGLRTSKWYWLSLGAFVLALLSKISTVMLPVVLLGAAWWQRGRITRQDWLRTGPFFLIALAFGLMGIWLQAHNSISGAAVQSENFWGRLAGAGMALWFYLGKALLPLNLCMIYPRWKIDAAAPGSYLPFLLWCGVLATCWGFRRSWGRHVLFGLGCFTVTLFPVLGFLDMYYLTLSRVVDHFVYLPLTALVALVAAALGSVLKGRGLWVAGGSVVVSLAVLATLRAQVFVSEEVLWRDTLAKNPAAWCAHANLGWILADQKKYEEARSQLETSLAQKPDNAQAHSNLGRVLSLQGKFGEAELHFQTALRLKPKDSDIRRAYASALTEQGRKDEAVQQLREVSRVRPDVDSRLQLATLLYQTRHLRDAVAEYRQVLAVKPDHLEALSNLAWLLATCSDASVRNGTEAVRFGEQACRLSRYTEARPLGALAAAYAEAGRFSEAVAAAQRSIAVARAAGDAGLATIGQQLLQLYLAGKPYHELPSTPVRAKKQ